MNNYDTALISSLFFIGWMCGFSSGGYYCNQCQVLADCN